MRRALAYKLNFDEFKARYPLLYEWNHWFSPSAIS